MNGSRMTRNVAMFALMLIGLSFAGQAAFAGFKWVVREVRVPYTYYAYETQTRYRTVRRRVVRTSRSAVVRRRHRAHGDRTRRHGAWLDSVGGAHDAAGPPTISSPTISYK